LRVKANTCWRGYVTGDAKYTGISISCNHGFNNNVMISDEHPVSHFMDTFFIEWTNEYINMADILSNAVKKHQEVWKDERYRNLICTLFTIVGINLILEDIVISNGLRATKPDHRRDGTICSALELVTVVLASEHYNGSGSIFQALRSRVVASKIRIVMMKFIATNVML